MGGSSEVRRARVAPTGVRARRVPVVEPVVTPSSNEKTGLQRLQDEWSNCLHATLWGTLLQECSRAQVEVKFQAELATALLSRKVEDHGAARSQTDQILGSPLTEFSVSTALDHAEALLTNERSTADLLALLICVGCAYAGLAHGLIAAEEEGDWLESEPLDIEVEINPGVNVNGATHELSRELIRWSIDGLINPDVRPSAGELRVHIAALTGIALGHIERAFDVNVPPPSHRDPLNPNEHELLDLLANGFIGALPTDMGHRLGIGRRETLLLLHSVRIALGTNSEAESLKVGREHGLVSAATVDGQEREDRWIATSEREQRVLAGTMALSSPSVIANEMETSVEIVRDYLRSLVGRVFHVRTHDLQEEVLGANLSAETVLERVAATHGPIELDEAEHRLLGHMVAGTSHDEDAGTRLLFKLSGWTDRRMVELLRAIPHAQAARYGKRHPLLPGEIELLDLWGGHYAGALPHDLSGRLRLTLGQTSRMMQSACNKLGVSDLEEAVSAARGRGILPPRSGPDRTEILGTRVSPREEWILRGVEASGSLEEIARRGGLDPQRVRDYLQSLYCRAFQLEDQWMLNGLSHYRDDPEGFLKEYGDRLTEDETRYLDALVRGEATARLEVDVPHLVRHRRIVCKVMGLDDQKLCEGLRAWCTGHLSPNS